MTPNSLLDRLSETVTAAQSTEQLTRPLLDLLELITGLESTYLTRIDLDEGLQTILYARNSAQMQIPEGLSVPWHDTLCKRALDEGRPMTEDAQACWGDSEAARALGIRTYVTTPLHLEDGTLFGTLCAASTTCQPLNAQGRQALTLFGTLIEQHLQREHMLDRLRAANLQLEAFSNTDPLTRLPNRRALKHDMQRLFALALREGRSVLVAFIDLDGFKAINDVHGHDAGDAFLIEIAERLQDGMRSSDILGRVGGDEFVVVGLGSPNAEGAEDAGDPADALRARLTPLLQGRIVLDTCTLDYAGPSLGVICADPARYTPQEALKHADAAMYVEKKARHART